MFKFGRGLVGGLWSFRVCMVGFWSTGFGCVQGCVEWFGPEVFGVNPKPLNPKRLVDLNLGVRSSESGV